MTNKHADGFAGLNIGDSVRCYFRALCDEFNMLQQLSVENASTEMLERASVLLAERVIARGDK